jgi:hypothetical protein
MNKLNEELKKFIKTFINDVELDIKSFKIIKNGIVLEYTRENSNDKFHLNKK